jgi:hypothetical protein
MTVERVVLDGQLVVRESSGAVPRPHQHQAPKQRRAVGDDD